MSCIVRGSINIDEFLSVPSIVRPGQTLSSTHLSRRPGGKGANQAVALARALDLSSHSRDDVQQLRVSLAGAVGADGTWIVDLLRDAGVDTRLVSVLREGQSSNETALGAECEIDLEFATTGRAIIQLTPEGENSIVLHRGANYYSPLPCDLGNNADGKQSKELGYTHLLLQNEIPWETTLSWLENSGALKRSGALGKFNARKATTFFNPSPMPTREQVAEFPWGKLDWLLVNEGEAGDLVELLSHEGKVNAAVLTPDAGDVEENENTDVVARASKLIYTLHSHPRFSKTANVICTLGAKGVLAFVPSLGGEEKSDAKAKMVYVPSAPLSPSQVVDTTGAGDCFTGYFVAGLMIIQGSGSERPATTKEDVERVLRRCVYAAGLCVTRRGAMESIPSGAEVDEFIKSHAV